MRHQNVSHHLRIKLFKFLVVYYLYFFCQASFLNKKLNVGGKKVNLSIWVSFYNKFENGTFYGITKIFFSLLYFLIVFWALRSKEKIKY